VRVTAGILGVEMPMRILVTGTSYGLGAAVSAAVKARGDVVFSMSRTPPDAGDEHWTRVDFGNTEEIGSAVSRLAEQLDGPLDGVVLNAALADKSVDQWTTDQVERHLRVNALAPVELWNQLDAAELLGSPCNVVLMGSFLQNGNVRQPAYAMSKAALWAWMRSYTMNQPLDSAVSMNMIWPARVETPANPRRELPPGDPNSFYSPERVAEVVLNYLYQAPSGPRGTVVDMGRS
jgi:NAD(P)-dependent dehydrogenase (short-subunit alcohol dehydrogenase family)